MSLLYYKRPDYVEKSTAPMAASDYRTYLERQRASIPPELCFEYVIANRAVPVRPITTFSFSLSLYLSALPTLLLLLQILDLKGNFFLKKKKETKALTFFG